MSTLAQVCVEALGLPDGVIPLRRSVIHSPSPIRFLRVLCGLSFAPLLPPLACPSVWLQLLVL